MNRLFPTVAENGHSRCCFCGHPLCGKVTDNGAFPGTGRYDQRCTACDMLTFYDLKSEVLDVSTPT